MYYLFETGRGNLSGGYFPTPVLTATRSGFGSIGGVSVILLTGNTPACMVNANVRMNLNIKHYFNGVLKRDYNGEANFAFISGNWRCDFPGTNSGITSNLTVYTATVVSWPGIANECSELAPSPCPGQIETLRGSQVRFAFYNQNQELFYKDLSIQSQEFRIENLGDLTVIHSAFCRTLNSSVHLAGLIGRVEAETVFESMPVGIEGSEGLPESPDFVYVYEPFLEFNFSPCIRNSNSICFEISAPFWQFLINKRRITGNFRLTIDQIGDLGMVCCGDEVLIDQPPGEVPPSGEPQPLCDCPDLVIQIQDLRFRVTILEGIIMTIESGLTCICNALLALNPVINVAAASPEIIVQPSPVPITLTGSTPDITVMPCTPVINNILDQVKINGGVDVNLVGLETLINQISQLLSCGDESLACIIKSLQITSETSNLGENLQGIVESLNSIKNQLNCDDKALACILRDAFSKVLTFQGKDETLQLIDTLYKVTVSGAESPEILNTLIDALVNVEGVTLNDRVSEILPVDVTNEVNLRSVLDQTDDVLIFEK